MGKNFQGFKGFLKFSGANGPYGMHWTNQSTLISQLVPIIALNWAFPPVWIGLGRDGSILFDPKGALFHVWTHQEDSNLGKVLGEYIL